MRHSRELREERDQEAPLKKEARVGVIPKSLTRLRNTSECLPSIYRLPKCGSPTHGDPLATPATIRSWPRQQANRQHLTSTARSLYPIAIDRERRTPLAHSSPSIPSSSLSPSIRMPLSKVHWGQRGCYPGGKLRVF